jgi:hypothetical protein
MITQAYFQHIRKHIKEELLNSTQSIYVAVAWFTDKHLFKVLCDKAKDGISVQLIVMDDNITRNCSINYLDLERNGGKLYKISESFGTLMHNKFCVIDEKTIITGSYNWSMKAATNHENITITTEAESLALTFINEFKRIKETYHGKDPLKEIDFSIVNKRLNVIDGLIQLEDYSDVLPHILKLKEFELTDPISIILEDLEEAKWFSASNKIKDYLLRSQALTLFDDFKANELKMRIKYLELEIVALENEKTTILKIISDFVHNYTIKFGELLSRILKLKKEKLQAEGNNRYEDFKKAEEAYQSFKEDFNREQEKEKDFTHLNDDQKDDLKKKYRKAASMCHPDVVANNFPDDIDKQKKAEELFKILNEANSKNDLNSVSQILENLENGVFEFQQEGNNSSSKREVLEARIAYLIEKLEILKQELFELSLDKTYRQVIDIKDLEDFYQREEERLNVELEELTK